jgi:hypothetical protein
MIHVLLRDPSHFIAGAVYFVLLPAPQLSSRLRIKAGLK